MPLHKSQADDQTIINAIDNWLSKATNGNIQKNHIMQLTNNVLSKYKEEMNDLNPPINLNILGKYMHIKRIILSGKLDKLDIDAILIPIEDGFKIELKKNPINRNLYKYRRRFSWAHEIAHTFFYDINNGSIPKRAVPRGTNYEEILCNKAATEFLMPLEIFNKKTLILTNNWGHTSKTIKAIANAFKTSYHTVSMRLIFNSKIMGWNKYVIMRWTPIYDEKRYDKSNNNRKKIKGFKLSWKVSEDEFLRDIPQNVYDDCIIFDELLPAVEQYRHYEYNKFPEMKFYEYGTISPLSAFSEDMIVTIPSDKYLEMLEELNKKNSNLPNNRIMEDNLEITDFL